MGRMEARFSTSDVFPHSTVYGISLRLMLDGLFFVYGERVDGQVFFVYGETIDGLCDNPDFWVIS
jgi:hypothetical protein